MAFMKKYIHVAKVMKPALTREAADFISEEYSKLRNQDSIQQNNLARVRFVGVFISKHECFNMYMCMYPELC